MSRPIAYRIAVALTGAVVALAVLTLFLAVVLSFTYVPSGAQAWDDPTFGGGSGWTGWHRWSAVLWILVAGGSVVTLTVLAATADSSRRTGVALGGTVMAGVAAVVALATRALVQWDQLALWAVTVGDGLDGYWPVLFDDGVRFVLIDGVEVEPGDYGVALAVHLLAHVVGVVAAVGSLVVLVARRPSPSNLVTDNSGEEP